MLELLRLIGAYVWLLVIALVRVSFYTLYERKILRYSHIRKGPNIVGWWGLLQPFRDALKLFTKELSNPWRRNYYIFYFSPVIRVLVALRVWLVLPSGSGLWFIKYLILLFFVLTAAGVYAHLGCGWASNSNYALVGALRRVAQRISYEISMAFLLILALLVAHSFELIQLSRVESTGVLAAAVIPGCMMLWVISCLVETNRAPFDFAEGESELVSGFNVEYGSGEFALLFIGEYTRIIFMSCLLRVLFFRGLSHRALGVGLTLTWMHWFIWARTAYPRRRYDKLMSLCWLVILPRSLILLIIALMLY